MLAFKNNPFVKGDDTFEYWVLEDIRQMAHQGMLDECEDYFVSEADLEQAQDLLKPHIRTLAPEDWVQMRNHFGGIPSKIIRNSNTFKYTTQHRVLLPLSHLLYWYKYSTSYCTCSLRVSCTVQR